jgi:membrane protease YdiL (CAAX protease family)
MAGYLLWAFEQQFILQDYFLFRLLRTLPNEYSAVVGAALLFSTAHIPNPVLMAVTLVFGLASCALFLHYRNLYALGLVHGILGLCVAISVPNAVTHHMTVGLGYLRYHH